MHCNPVVGAWAWAPTCTYPGMLHGSKCHAYGYTEWPAGIATRIGLAPSTGILSASSDLFLQLLIKEITGNKQQHTQGPACRVKGGVRNEVSRSESQSSFLVQCYKAKLSR